MAIETEGSPINGESIRPNQQFSNPTDDSTRMPNVPHEIIVEILTRLPVKSLSRFRCVCKSWLSVISDRKFIKMHLHMSTIDDNCSRHRIIFTCNGDFSFNSCSLYSIFNQLRDEVTELDHPIKDSNRVGCIIGSYDGLICISFKHENLYLWNPSLRRSRRLPHFGVRVGVGAIFLRFSVFGFGYDYSTDDYKVVAMSFLLRHGGISSNDVKVYTLRTNSWRRIQEFPCSRPDIEVGKFVSGSLHWQSSHHSFSGLIIALDLATETYHDVALPTYEYTNGHYFPTLGVLGGCLCVMINSHKGHANLWVMKEYGVRESWTILVTIPYSSGVSIFPHPFDVPLSTSKNSEIFLRSGVLFKIYNSKDDTFKSPVIPDSLDNCHESAIYIESLVSPNPEDSLEGDSNIEEQEVARSYKLHDFEKPTIS